MTRAELQLLVNRVADQLLGPAGGAAPVAEAPSAEGGAIGAEVPPRSASPLVPLAAVAAAIDHTNLRPEARREDILHLCEEALVWRFATVCVYSIWVPLAHQVLRGSSVKVCTVAGFPSGAVPTPVKRLEAEIAIRNGAEEVDMVLPVGLLRRGEWDLVRQDIAEVAKATSGAGALLKVILESAALNDNEIAIACALSRLAGAQFVKTSTGFHPAGGAQPRHVVLMRQAVGNDLGVKASGGIRTIEDAETMLASGANRIGASASVAIVSALRQNPGG